MSDYKNYTPRKKNALDNTKLRLSSDPVNGGKQRPTFSVSLVKNNPRFTVWTNVDGDKDKGKIEAKMDPITFFSVLSMLKKAKTEEAGWRVSIENKNYLFPGGKRTETPVVVSTTHVGKDKDGVVWISVTARDRPKIQFKLLSGFWHVLKNSDGSDLDKAQDSQLFIDAFVEILSGLTSSVLNTEYEPPEPKKPTGGGYNNNNNSAPSVADNKFDDDLPF